MKALLTRAIVEVARRGKSRASRFAWWSRWFPSAPTVEAERFQSESEPYPDHWKEFPAPWPDSRPGHDTLGPLQTALADLPEPWRRVVVLRDVNAMTPEQVTDAIGMTSEQQRDILNRAREVLRQALDRSRTPGPEE